MLYLFVILFNGLYHRLSLFIIFLAYFYVIFFCPSICIYLAPFFSRIAFSFIFSFGISGIWELLNKRSWLSIFSWFVIIKLMIMLIMIIILCWPLNTWPFTFVTPSFFLGRWWIPDYIWAVSWVAVQDASRQALCPGCSPSSVPLLPLPHHPLQIIKELSR